MRLDSVHPSAAANTRIAVVGKSTPLANPPIWGAQGSAQVR